MIRLVISGIAGRMGKRIALLASKDKDFNIVAGLEIADSPAIGKDVGEVVECPAIKGKVYSDFKKLTAPCDVIIEFTYPEVTMQHLEVARNKHIAIVIGTTALSDQQIKNIKKASGDIPIVFSPNMSVGANLLFSLAEIAARLPEEDYDVEIIEAHHAGKKDAPSGTAKRLGEAVSKVRGKVPPIESIREGDIVGDHTVIFRGKEEKIELKHSAFSRDAFARGALSAARFLKGRKSGLYTMQDVIRV